MLSTNHLLTALFLLWSAMLFGQKTDSLGSGDNTILNEQEADYLNSLLKDSNTTFNLKDKQVAFVTGGAGNILLSKKRYFDNYVKPWLIKGRNPQVFIVKFTEEEKIKSGGYDVIILSWVKVFTDGRKRKIITQLKSISKFSK